MRGWAIAVALILAGGATAAAGAKSAAPRSETPKSAPPKPGPGKGSAPPVPAVCMVAVTPLSFGTPSGRSITATATVTVTCPAGTPYTIALQAGGSGGATGRRLRAGVGPTLPYELYQDAGRQVVWGDHGFDNTYPRGEVKTGKGTGAAQVHPVFAAVDVPAKSPPAASTYTDAVTVALHF